MSSTPTAVDLDALKVRQRDIWSSDDYAVVGSPLQITGERLCESLDVEASEHVLDVAAGNGNAALAAARRGCEVTATDYVEALLGQTRARADDEGLAIEIREADAEDLPFADHAFDVVISTFGVMFTPQPERATSELLRVCRPGGRIGLANWAPESFVGQLLKIVACYVPPPEGIPSPLDWGYKARIGELFGARVQSIGIRQREFVFRYRSPRHWYEAFRRFYGPIHKAFAVLDESEGIGLERDLLALATAHNTSRTGALRIPSVYLEVVTVSGE